LLEGVQSSSRPMHHQTSSCRWPNLIEKMSLKKFQVIWQPFLSPKHFEKVHKKHSRQTCDLYQLSQSRW